MIKPITINKILQKPSLWEGWVGFCLLLLLSSPLLAQSKKEKEKDIHNTKSSAIIDGVHYKLHTVEKGQTLFNIAKFYNLTVNDLVIDNPEAIDGIKPGEVIKIAIEKKKIITSADSSHFTLVKIQAGQTMYSLSKQYAITIEKLKVINPELNEGLKIGQVVKIPIEKKKTETVAKPTKTETPVVENKTINPKDEKKIAVAVSPVKITTVENVPVIDKVEEKELPSVTDYSGIKKSEYKIAFFLPFHVDEVNAIDMEKVIKGEEQLPNKTNVALQYFEGALLAIDSLKKQNVNVKIFVYDIDEKDSLNIANTLKKPELASMDLMIGPLYGSSFMPIASYAKEKHIAIVSPFTQLNKILFSNPYVCKLSPSSTLQIEQMAHYAVDTFQTQNIILINNISTKEAANYNSFKTRA
jgi:LysM repeat protein